MLAIEMARSERVTKGHDAIIPPPRPTSAETVATLAPDLSLDAALAQASASQCAVMVVFPYFAWAAARQIELPQTRGMDIKIPPTSAFLLSVWRGGDEGVAAAAVNAHLLLVAPDREPGRAFWTSYLARLDRFGVKAEAPLVLFLAPDGTILRKLTGQVGEKDLVAAIQTVPPLLANWITEKRKPIAPAPPATKGHGP